MHRFGRFELDAAAGELRVDGKPVTIQPQVLSVLSFLVERPGRVVSKRELLDEVWADAHVTESSVERAVSLARKALGSEGSKLIVTVPKRGYRFTAPAPDIAAPPQELPAPRYAKNGDVHLAYRVLGDGDSAIVLINGWVFAMDSWGDDPSMREHVEHLSVGRRLVLFDKRGTGLSDRVKRLPTLDQRMDDLRAVLDAAGVQKATILGYSEGAPLALLFAASLPERTRGLVLVGGFARMTSASGYPWGWSEEQQTALEGYIDRSWGAGRTVRAIAVDRVGEPSWERWSAKAERIGASPGAAKDLLAMNCAIDVRSVLAAVKVPTTIIHSEEDSMFGVGNARFLAERVAGARLIELPGANHLPLLGNEHMLLAAVDRYEAMPAPEEPAATFLTTVVATAAPHPKATAVFDEEGATRIWRQAQLACFDGPVRALAAARRLASVGAAVHTGQARPDARGLAGAAVDDALALADRASEGEVRVSRIVRDLVPGAGLTFSAAPDADDLQLDV